jgi:subtilisin family serine protease
LDLVRLRPLMELSSGRREVTIALIDGPVIIGHSELSNATIREIPGRLGGDCERSDSFACMHGTFVAGILWARRGSSAPAICPDCTLLVRPIFAEGRAQNRDMPSATPDELATAIFDCVAAGAHVINLSAALVKPSSKGERRLQQALDHSAKRGILIVVAAGNQGMVGSSVITRHPWVISVTACDLRGQPISYSNLGHSIGQRGLSAPGEGITSLGVNGQASTFGGTSAAAPFVTGAVALLLSIFPTATPATVKLALTAGCGTRRRGVVPPLMNAWDAYKSILMTYAGR